MPKPRLKGFDKFREKASPRFAGKKIAFVPVIFLSGLLFGLLLLTLFINLPNLLVASGIDPVLLACLPILGLVIVVTTGFILVYQMWFWRDRLKAKLGILAYQKIVPIGFFGIVIVISMGFCPLLHIGGVFWTTSSLSVLVSPLESFLGAGSVFIYWPRVVLAICTIIVGLGMSLRAVTTFGFDYTTVVYLYFPEESQVQKNAIYSALRHPMYSGVLTACLGSMLFTFTPYAIAFYLIYLLGFTLHVRFVEERELLQRFGASYQEYQKTVPAFFVSPAKLRVLLGFVFRAPKENQ